MSMILVSMEFTRATLAGELIDWSEAHNQINISPQNGKLIKFPRVGGLHNRYYWKKAA
jgi:hypothetical protein